MNAFKKVFAVTSTLRQYYMDALTREFRLHQSSYTQKVSQHKIKKGTGHQP